MNHEPPPHVRAFLERVRAVDDPTPERRVRIHRAFQARLAALGVPALESPPSIGDEVGGAAAGSLARGLVRWLVLGTTVGGLGLAAVALLGSEPRQAAPPRVVLPEVQPRASQSSPRDLAPSTLRASDSQRDSATDEQQTVAAARAAAAASQPRVERRPSAPVPSRRRSAGPGTAAVIESDSPGLLERPRSMAPRQVSDVRPRSISSRPVSGGGEALAGPPAANDEPARESTLEQEVRLIRAIRRAVRDRDGARARRLIAEHEARFADGVLREERLGLRVILLCGEGPSPTALEARESFLRRSADSVIAPQVRVACDQASQPGPRR